MHVTSTGYGPCFTPLCPQVMVTVKSPDEAAVVKKLYPSLRKLDPCTVLCKLVGTLKVLASSTK